jgi:hypothetical protein
LSGQRNVIIFYTEGCEICDAQKAAARHLLKSDYNVNGKLNVLLINVDDILRDNPTLASKLFDSFDLSTLPFLIETDNRGIILRRYFLL